MRDVHMVKKQKKHRLLIVVHRWVRADPRTPFKFQNEDTLRGLNEEKIKTIQKMN